MHLFGLTGGIATGKSMVARMLRDLHGIPVIDADAVSREVVAIGQPAYQQIVDRFGTRMVLPSGALDRAALRAHVFSDDAARQDLEAITHPAIRARMTQHLEQLAREGHLLAGVEAALLVETGSYKMYQTLVVVSASDAVQRQRLVERDGSTSAQVEQVLQAQMPQQAKIDVADLHVDNSGGLEELSRRVDDLALELMARCQ